MIQHFNRVIARTLRADFVPPEVVGGHDYTHCERMLAIGRKIDWLKFEWVEFELAVWFHNLDRHEDYIPAIRQRGFADVCRGFIDADEFSPEMRERVIDAVTKHDLKDEPSDASDLLKALRIADKVDRIGALGIIASAACRHNMMPYDPERPFGQVNTSSVGIQTVYDDLMRLLEYYSILDDRAKKLVPGSRVKFLVDFIRELGTEIAEATGKPNTVESDIAKVIDSKIYQILGPRT